MLEDASLSQTVKIVNMLDTLKDALLPVQLMHFRIDSTRFARDPKPRFEETFNKLLSFGLASDAYQGTRKLDVKKALRN